MIAADESHLLISEEALLTALHADVKFLRQEAEKISSFPIEEAKFLSYERFMLDYLLPNKPVLIRGLERHEFAPCRSQWLQNDTSPNLDAIAQLYGDDIVPVAYCNSQKGYDQERTEMKFSEAAEEWKAFKSSYQTSDPMSLSTERIPYIKDWHLTRRSEIAPFYQLPIFFGEDWLNHFFDHREAISRDDYRFVYLGPKSSWTPLHSDVLRSYSWSHNVCGRKLWIFYPPSEKRKIQDHLGNYHVDVRSQPDAKFFPHWCTARSLTVIQEAGETVFVPSHWHHQVHNLGDTISINHNWGNAHNLDLMWEYLLSDYISLRESILDLLDMFENESEFESHCQLLLRVNAGMNFHDFCEYLYSSMELCSSEKIDGRIRLLNKHRVQKVVYLFCDAINGKCEYFSELKAKLSKLKSDLDDLEQNT